MLSVECFRKIQANFRLWPEAGPHTIASERLLSVKADTQNYKFGKSVAQQQH
jgi:hypothetical protein